MKDWADWRRQRLAWLNERYGEVPDDGPYDELWWARCGDRRWFKAPPALRADARPPVWLVRDD